MTLTVDTVVEKYIKLRDKRSEIKKAYEAEDAKYRDAQDKCESWLLRQCIDLGVDNLSVRGVGMAIKKREMQASCKDWLAFHKWVKENDQLDMFERRLSRGVLKAYMEDHGGDVPPGVDVIFEDVVTVRRATQTKE